MTQASFPTGHGRLASVERPVARIREMIKISFAIMIAVGAAVSQADSPARRTLTVAPPQRRAARGWSTSDPGRPRDCDASISPQSNHRDMTCWHRSAPSSWVTAGRGGVGIFQYRVCGSPAVAFDFVPASKRVRTPGSALLANATRLAMSRRCSSKDTPDEPSHRAQGPSVARIGVA